MSITPRINHKGWNQVKHSFTSTVITVEVQNAGRAWASMDLRRKYMYGISPES